LESSYCKTSYHTLTHAQKYTMQLTQLFIFGLHSLWYKWKWLILAVLGCDRFQFGEFSLKRDCSHYQWHLEFQKVSFSSNIHKKLETNILTSLFAYIRRAQFILCVIQGMDEITGKQFHDFNRLSAMNPQKETHGGMKIRHQPRTIMYPI